MLRRYRARLALGSLSLFVIVALAGAGCDETVDAVRIADGGATGTDASSLPPIDAATDAPGDAHAEAGACNDTPNAAPIVRAMHVNAPFPTGMGQGGEFGGGRYFLTSVTYYGETADAGDAGSADGDAGDAAIAEPADFYWQTTIDATVTLGTDLERAWHAGKASDLSGSPVHHESLLLDPVTPTTVKLKSVCSDLPIEAVVEYTATPTTFTLYLPDPGRVETYVKQ